MKSQPVSKADLEKGLNNLGDSLRDDMQDMARHFTTALGKHGERVDGQFSLVNGRLTSINQQLIEVNTKLDAIMSGEILVTRKQVERLISALEAKGIKLNVSEILAA